MTSTTIDRERETTDRDSSESDEWVVAYYYSPEFRERVEAGLNRLLSLPANWDSDGARTIESQLVEAARKFVGELPENLISPPAVVPMAKGNLQLEWHSGPRSLELEFESPSMIHYLKWHPEEGVEDEGFFSSDDVDRAVGLIRWFVGGVANV
jgi:hypothetical protein